MPWFWRKQREQDLERELHSHLELEAEEQGENGLSPEDARYAAQRAFGNTTYVKEQVRGVWGWTALEGFWRDLRYAVRMLCRTPIFTAVAVLSLTLGIGANTALFTLLNAVLLQLLPVAHPAQLVQLTYTMPTDKPENWNSYFDYPQLKRFGQQAKTLSGLFGGVTFGRVNIGLHGIAGLASCDAYTGNFFSVLGLTPQQGRLFATGDDAPGSAVVVLSNRYWRIRFASDPAIVGQTITINQLPFTVIGIAPPNFDGLYPGASRDIWIPLHALDLFKPDPERWSKPFTSWLTLAGRLAPGVSLERAQAELDVLHRQLLAEQLATSERPSQFQRRMVQESHLLLRPAGSGIINHLQFTYARPLKLLLAIAGIVLLISCANVANLVLARAAHRRREIALRMALGSGRARVVQQVLTESLLLAGVGGVVALAIARWGGTVLVRMISTGDTPIQLDLYPDWRVFAFTLAISLVSGLLFGLMPAIRGTHVDPGAALKEIAVASGGPRRLDRSLVPLQIALSVILVTGTGLFARTLANLRSVDIGSNYSHILLFSVDPALAGYPKERRPALYHRIIEKLTALPGVQSVSSSVVRPVVDNTYSLVDAIHYIDGRQLPDVGAIHVAWNALSPGYFATVGIPILLGQDFTYRDAGKVVIINESLAHRAFPKQNPIGHQLDGAEVIGVVKDTLYNGLRNGPQPVLYRSLFQLEGTLDPSQWVGVGFVSFEMRYRSGTGAVEDVRRAITSIDRNLPIFHIKTLRAQTDDSLVRERLLATLSGVFGFLALLLAGLGLYGLMTYAVTRRTAEIGIRMALGACHREVIWLILRETLGLVLIGIAAGVPLAVMLSRYTKSLLFGVAPTDPGVLAASVTTLIVIALLAGFLPACRASRIDPMIALRYQ